MRLATRAPVLTATAWMVVSAAACATTGGTQRPERSRVTVGVSASGPGVAAMTFRVTIEPAGLSGTIKGDAGLFTANDVPAGEHVVRLTDVPSRCRVEGGADRKITASPARTAVLRYVVNCS